MSKPRDSGSETMAADGKQLDHNEFVTMTIDDQ